MIGGARGPDLGVRVARIQDASYPVALEEVREAGEVGGGEGSGIAVPNDLGDREPVHLDVAAEEPVQEDLLALGIVAPEAPARGSNVETSCFLIMTLFRGHRCWRRPDRVVDAQQQRADTNHDVKADQDEHLDGPIKHK